MSLFYVKSILSIFFGVAAVVAIGAMLSLMGKAERKLSGKVLRRTHRTAGWIAVTFIVVISYFCIKYVALAGDALSVRAVIHGVLALFLIVVLALKILIVRVYREFMRFAPVLGIIVFSLVFVVVATSAGYFFVKEWCGPDGTVEAVGEAAVPMAAPPGGDAEAGRAIFEANCAICHHADSEEAKIGPGLAGITTRETLRATGEPPSRENVARQIVSPVGGMPSFESRLSGEELGDVVEYLTTL